MSIVSLKLRNSKRALNSISCIKANKEIINNRLNNCHDIKINVIEIHLTDICDLNCSYCSYKSGVVNKRDTLKYSTLDTIIELKPQAIVLAGGGEPVLYKDDNYTIHNVIDKLHENSIAVGLITNGGKDVAIDVLNKLSWLRVSLDAIGDIPFFALKKGKFSKRLAFLKKAIRSDCRHIGIGFLYNDNNLRDTLSACEYIHTQLKDDRVNIQFRPTCKIQSCDCPSENYSSDNTLTSNRETWWAEEIASLTEKLEIIKNKNVDLYNFIIRQTNFLSILKPNFNERKAQFSSCYISLARWIIRADGNIYPCVMKATNFGIPIGNIKHDLPVQIKEGMKGYFDLERKYCQGPLECCNFVSVTNKLIECNIKTQAVNETTLNNDEYFF